MPKMIKFFMQIFKNHCYLACITSISLWLILTLFYYQKTKYGLCECENDSFHSLRQITPITQLLRKHQEYLIHSSFICVVYLLGLI